MRRGVAAYLETARGMPLGHLLRKAGKKVLLRIGSGRASARAREADLQSPTYWQGPVPTGDLARLLAPVAVDALRGRVDAIRGLTDQYLAHRFDLMGSGWTRVAHGVRCRGLEGNRYAMGAPARPAPAAGWLQGRTTAANEAEARARWSRVSPGYQPIDWHLDFRSGYRWREDLWYRDVGVAPAPGADVKVPRELGRTQHLAQLALAYGLAREDHEGFRPPGDYVTEFRNQILDFTTSNPPRFGVNWACTMEVAIRVANWCTAYDLFRAYGEGFDPDFSGLFLRTVFEHALHIAGNLEWNPVSPETRGNHYLADVVGLLFASAYLPSSPRTDAWLAFAVQELIEEVQFQFHAEGTNREASTGYHGLCTELAVHATALVQGLPEDRLAALERYVPGSAPELTRLLPPGRGPRFPRDGVELFPPAYLQRLQRAGEFAAAVTKPDGRMHQVGDQDSGHFLKLAFPVQALTTEAARRRYANLSGYEERPDDAAYWDEDLLDCRHVTEAAEALFPAATRCAKVLSLDASLVAGWLAGRPLAAPIAGVKTTLDRVGDPDGWRELHHKLRARPPGWLTERTFPGPGLRAVTRMGYPAFGLFVFRAPNFYLALRTGAPSQNHAHNDVLALELFAEGRSLIADPGSYAYTALPERRNAYRSVHAHDAPFWPGREPGRLDLGLFLRVPRVRAECLYFGPEGCLGRLRYRGSEIYRLVEVAATRVTVLDVVPPNIPSGLPLSVAVPEPVLFSPGYGKLLAAQGKGD